MRSLFIALALLFAGGPALAQSATPAGWKLFRFPEQHVMFWAPAEAHPTVSSQTSTVEHGQHPVTEYRIVVEDGPGDHWAWMISSADAAVLGPTPDIDGVPQGAANGIKATIIGSVHTVSVAGANKALEYDAASDTLLLRSRVLLRGTIIYQAMAITDAKTLPPGSDAFLASVTPLP